jgi:hypothetical protein
MKFDILELEKDILIRYVILPTVVYLFPKTLKS